MGIKIKGLASLSSKISEMTRNQEALKHGIDMASAVVESKAKHLVPSRGSGLLRNSIGLIPAVVKDEEITGGVKVTSNYAVFVEFGTGVKANGSYPYPTQIPLAYSSKDKWVYTTDGGETFKTARSKPARPFLGRALHESERDIDQIVLRGFRKSIRGKK